MARYNEILAGRFNRLIQKLLSMKGSASLVSIDDSMQAVIPLFHGTENRYLEGWERFGITFFSAVPAAGNFAQFRLRNPVASNVVGVLEKIVFFSNVQVLQNLGIATQTLDLANSVSNANTRFDARTRPAPVLIGSQTTTALTNAPIFQFAAINPANANLEVLITDIQEIPLLPGDGLTVGCNAAAIALNIIVWWRERQLEDSERA